jgi:glycosyltransferase involved in cell wall biosynthesis
VHSGYTKFIYPMKLHEYLATGRPVVGTPIRSLMDFGHVVRLASTPAEWSAAIVDALAHPEVGRAERQATAGAHDWTVLAARIAKVFVEGLPGRAGYLHPGEFTGAARARLP